MCEVAAEPRDKGGERDERHHGRAAEVAPHHDLLAIHAIGDDASWRREQHGRDGVRQERDRHRGAAARDVIREDDQGEEQELVRELRGQLREPDVPERRVPQDRSETTRALDRKPDRLFHER